MNLKSFGKNTIIYGFGNLAIRFTGFLLIPLYTRCLSISDFGLLATLLVTVQVMIIFMSMQMQPAFVRFYREFESKGLIGQLLGSSILVNLAGCVVLTGFSLTILPGVFRDLIHGGSVLPYLALSCWVAASQSLCIHVMYYYRARNEALEYTLFAVLSAVLVVFLTVLFLVIFHLGVKGILTAQAVSFGIVAMIISSKLFQRLKPTVSFSVVRQLFGFSTPLIFSGSAWFIMNASDRYFLAHFMGLEVVGIYSLGYKLASILLLLVVHPFQMAYGPFIFASLGASDIKDTLARLFRYLVSALLLVALGIALGGSFLVRLIAPPDYGEAYLVSLCILPVGAMIGIYYWAGALIHIVKKTHILGVTMTLGAGLNLMLNYLLIPHFGWLGAALATNLSVFLAAAGVFVIGMQLFPVPLRRQFVPAIIGSLNAIRKVTGSLGRIVRILLRAT